MKTEYEFLVFAEFAEDKNVWICRNKHHGEELGRVQWYKPWRQYIYEPSHAAIYSVGCLNDIADFIKQFKPGI